MAISAWRRKKSGSLAQPALALISPISVPKHIIPILRIRVCIVFLLVWKRLPVGVRPVVVDSAGEDIEDRKRRVDDQADGRLEEGEEDGAAVDRGAAEHPLEASAHDL